MRNQWRLLLLRSCRRSHLHPSSSSCFQVASISHRSLSSLLRGPSENGALGRMESSLVSQPSFASSVGIMKSVSRTFSSEPAAKEKLPEAAVLIDIFSRLSNKDEITKELDSSGVVLSHDLALEVMKGLARYPDPAKRFFNWVLENDAEKLSNDSWNVMLCSLGCNGYVDEFWGMVDTMKEKGYTVSPGVKKGVGKKFKEDGLQDDYRRLKYDYPMTDERIVFNLARTEWSDDVEKRLIDSGIEFHSDLVKIVVEKLDFEPVKALIFFRWVEESNLFKHNAKTYNVIARVLAREMYIDRFWNIIKEMRSKGYELESETYIRASKRFCSLNLIEEAAELCEFAMAQENCYSKCFTMLLKKIVTAKTLDLGLFSRVLKVYTRNGNSLTDSMLNSVLKSLRDLGRLDQSNAILKAMKEENYVPSGDMQRVIALGLSRKGNKGEVSKLESFMEASGSNLDDKASMAVVEGSIHAGELDQASEYFKKMVDNGAIPACSLFEKLVTAYCNKKQARDAYALLVKCVKENQLKPSHVSYKLLVRSLVAKKIVGEGGFEEALSLLPMMKSHGFPPYVDPLIDYVAKTGSNAQALAMLKAMTSNKFPSINVISRVFKAMLKQARVSEAQELLSLCPKFVRSHADVLELFSSVKSNDKSAEKALAT